MAHTQQLLDTYNGDVTPDCTFFLDLPAAEIQGRLQQRGPDAADRFETLGHDFFTNVRAGYYQELEPELPFYHRRVKKIDATLSVDEVHQQVVDHLTEHFFSSAVCWATGQAEGVATP